MTDAVVTRALFSCDGAAIPDEARRPGDLEFAIRALGDDPDTTMVIEHLVRKTNGEPESRVLDLFRIATYAFSADRLVVRTGEVQMDRERWRRELVLCVPVTDPAFWSDAETTRALTEALGFGTGDTWSFRFAPAPPDGGQVRIRWAPEPTALYAGQPDSVVLFSGGTDSLCALVDLLRRDGRRPIVVSHWAAKHVRFRQDRLLRDVRRVFDRWDMPHVSFEIHRDGEGTGERTQRSRGFLYAALGAVVAAHVGATEVVLADNGFVSVNPPINEQLVGSLASRGTHPKFLLLVNRLLARVFGGRVRVANPLWKHTRAEALRILVDAGCPQLLAGTYSCGKVQAEHTGKPHCGGCSQCIDRRVAVVRAGLEEHDPIAKYDLDLFRDPLPDGEARTVALSYVRFADTVSAIEPEWLPQRIPQLEECFDPDDPDFEERSVEIPNVLKRHAEEVLWVLGEMAGRYKDGLVRKVVRAPALLPLWLAGGDDRGDGRSPDAYGVAPTPPRPRFERSGRVWLIQFRGVLGGLPAQTGTHRLARLIREEGRELEALDIAAETSPKSKPRTSGKQGVETPEECRTPGPGDAGTLLDKKAVKRYRRMIDELEAKIAMTIAKGDEPSAAHHRNELAWVRRQLKEGLARDGQLRGFAEQHELARSTVSKTVWEQVDLLQPTMPELHVHLHDWLHLGYLCWYDPNPRERWEVTP